MKTFDQVWETKIAEGYQYGEDALEQVRFGFELAQLEQRTRPTESSPFELVKRELIEEFASIIHELSPGEVDDWIALKAAQQKVLEACASQDEFDVDWVEAVAQAELERREIGDACRSNEVQVFEILK
jgi:hypothetical protein